MAWVKDPLKHLLIVSPVTLTSTNKRLPLPPQNGLGLAKPDKLGFLWVNFESFTKNHSSSHLSERYNGYERSLVSLKGPSTRPNPGKKPPDQVVSRHAIGQVGIDLVFPTKGVPIFYRHASELQNKPRCGNSTLVSWPTTLPLKFKSGILVCKCCALINPGIILLSWSPIFIY